MGFLTTILNQFPRNHAQPIDDALLKTMDECVVNKEIKKEAKLEERCLRMTEAAKRFQAESETRSRQDLSFATKFTRRFADDTKGLSVFYFPFLRNVEELSNIDKIGTKNILKTKFMLSNDSIPVSNFCEVFDIPISVGVLGAIPDIPEKQEDENKIYMKIANYWKNFVREYSEYSNAISSITLDCKVTLQP